MSRASMEMISKTIPGLLSIESSSLMKQNERKSNFKRFNASLILFETKSNLD